MKKIIVILGDGRTNGNTIQLAESFMKGAIEAGHQIELVSLNKLNVNGCTGCNAVEKDDFNSLVPKIKTADLIVNAN